MKTEFGKIEYIFCFEVICIRAVEDFSELFEKYVKQSAWTINP